MKRRPSIPAAVALAAGLAALATLAAFAAYAGAPRTLAALRGPDGSEVRGVGEPRAFGLLGVEVVRRAYGPDGRGRAGAVKDLCRSWEEAERKYANPDGGGLLSATAE